ALADRLVVRPAPGRRRARLVLFAAAGVFMTLAMMRPQWGLQFVSTPQVGAEIMIALDVSRSMLAEDVAPNRLERAKADLRDLLVYLRGDQVGLIAFAGRASVLSPLTPDFSFLRLVLDGAGPHSVTRGGTRLEEPIRRAVAGFGDDTGASRSIILITDGEDHDSFPAEAAKEAAERGIKILAIGFGDEAGSQILITDPKTGLREPLRDADGKLVQSRLDGDMLRQLASITDGAYVPAGTAQLDLESIYQRHISGLTRGRLDGRARAVRNEAFQWAALLALVCLALAAATTAGATNDARKSGTGALSLLLLLTSLLASPLTSSATTTAHAQPTATPPDQAAVAVATATEGPDEPNQAADAEEAKAGDGKSSDEGLLLRPDDGREAYNLALRRMNEGRLDRSAELYEHAREVAGTDAEARARATFNRAWIDVTRADVALADDPQAALESLQGAADWFRRTLALRPGDDEARMNLELVLRRARALADSLAEKDETPLLDRINTLIERQREFAASMAETMEAAAQSDQEGPAALERLRARFRLMSADELDMLSEAEGVADEADRELAPLVDVDPDDPDGLAPEQRVRAVQLTNTLAYLHRARERMGQTRSRLRRLEAESAYRRASNAMAELKRARDQLLDPVTVLDALIADASELVQLTGLGISIKSQAYDGPPRPWLDKEWLADNATSLGERTEELGEGMRAGLEGANEQAAAAEEQLPADQQTFLEAVGQAAPLLADAASALSDVNQLLLSGDLLASLGPQRTAITAMVDARERFLDLRRLIDLAWNDETRLDQVLASKDHAPQPGQPPALTDEQLLELIPGAVELQQRNLDRASRIANALKDAKAALPRNGDEAAAEGGPSPEEIDAERQRLAMASNYLVTARAAMDRAKERLETADSSKGVVGSSALADARREIGQATEHLFDLRRLFFNVVEHLQDLLRRQVELGDETEEVAALARVKPDEDHSEKSGPLAPRQETHANQAQAISAALAQQAVAIRQSAASGAQQQQPQQPGAPAPEEQAAAMDTASVHVANAQTAMMDATGDLAINPAPMGEVRGQQIVAVAELTAALQALSPPPPPEEQEPEEQEEQQEPEEQDGGEDEQPSEEEQQAEPPPADAQRLLQGIRDREAERRAERENNDPARNEPVEKDW
ncbi:MAG: Ca-activated chloride channel family protein, partial [Hyphomicrobiaceae bacterium]